MIHDGQEYKCILGSDVIRDGFYFEVNEEPGGTNVMEIFHSDVTDQMTVTLFKQDIPIEVVEWAIAIAYERFPATKKQQD